MFITVLLLTLLAQGAASVPVPTPAAARGYVAERVYDTRRGAFADFEVMLADLAGADVVFVGEQHDDPNTHLLEHAMLDGLRRRRVAPIVSLEMFERDVQGGLDKYLAGTLGEPEFLKETRPWPRYATDYRPLVELAKSNGWSVVAANVPRRYAADVAKTGPEALDALAAGERALIARDLQCPRDGYFERFVTAMSGHSADEKKTGQAQPADAKMERYYWSQCVKDETMAESIADALDRRGGKGPIVHFNGAFHSDFGAGTAERTRRRLSGRRVAIVTILPVADLDALAPAGDDLKRADFLVYTIK